MKRFMVGFTIIAALVYLCHVKCDTIGGISPEKWSSKCKKHYAQYGDAAANLYIYIDGICERYKCQKYGNDMYGVVTDECKQISIHRDGCRIVKSTKNKQYPFCCPKVECDRRKPKLEPYY